MPPHERKWLSPRSCTCLRTSMRSPSPPMRGAEAPCGRLRRSAGGRVVTASPFLLSLTAQVDKPRPREKRERDRTCPHHSAKATRRGLKQLSPVPKRQTFTLKWQRHAAPPPSNSLGASKPPCEMPDAPRTAPKLMAFCRNPFGFPPIWHS